jgi:hypothetical protein
MEVGLLNPTLVLPFGRTRRKGQVIRQVTLREGKLSFQSKYPVTNAIWIHYKFRDMLLI